ncbi:glycoside hydrolase family 32 protein [Halorhabdus rudnickae]|uniref:glycoside hydrolase family 32 protein n=1 Tax=Halorhabdus rudnickae TaxID=1775544 RepID=UPI00143858BB|nr:glycoside hydrolase family 32 protein [Halorhabdus rudnickae]
MHYATDLPDAIERRTSATRARRRRFNDDPYRPNYHFFPPGGLLHDPNGALYWDGRYHLFYQYWPPDVSETRDWSEAMHWGHAVSDDLVHWRDLPIALSPDGGPERGCYSGQALVEDDRAVLMYFGTDAGNCIATGSDDYLLEFERFEDNPVVPIDEDAPYEIFDPCLWKDGETYRSLSGWKTDRQTTEFLFESDDLHEWTYRGPLVQDGFHTDPDEDGAVPNFFALDGTHVLLFFSHPRGPQYYLGEYDEDEATFDVEAHGRLNHGPVDQGNLHAPSVLQEGDRRVAFFNVVEGRRDWQADPTEGWTGVIGLPRDLSIEDGRLRLDPVEELATLRRNHRHVGSVSLPSETEWRCPESGGRSIELRAEVDPGDADQIDLAVLRSPDGSERTTVSYWRGSDALGIETGRSSTDTDIQVRPPEVGSLDLDDDEPLSLRIFVDRSIVEVFANGRETLTTRVYPSEESTGISLLARRGSAYLCSLDIWTMDDIWQREE